MNTAKCLGILQDEHLQWSKYVPQVQVKLSRGIGFLSKLRHNANLKTLKIVYHLLFASHLQYSA